MNYRIKVRPADIVKTTDAADRIMVLGTVDEARAALHGLMRATIIEVREDYMRAIKKRERDLAVEGDAGVEIVWGDTFAPDALSRERPLEKYYVSPNETTEELLEIPAMLSGRPPDTA